MPSFEDPQPKSSASAKSAAHTPEGVLNVLADINPAAFAYISGIRRNENAPTFLSSTYGDFLKQVGIICRAESDVNRASKNETYILTEESEAWFDLHPELDPLVQDVARSKSRIDPTPTPPKPNVDQPQATIEPSKSFTVEYPIRCILISAQGIPTKIGIIRSIRPGGVEVELPAEGRSPTITHEKFLSTTPPYWRAIANDDHGFDHLDGFKALLDQLDLIEQIDAEKSGTLEDAVEEVAANECASQTIEKSIEPKYLPAIQDSPAAFPIAVDPLLKELLSASLGAGEDRLRLVRSPDPTRLPVIPTALTEVRLTGSYDWRANFEFPFHNLKLAQPEHPPVLPHKVQLEHPFSIDGVEIGDVLFLRNPYPSLWGLFLGFDQDRQRAALWLVGSDKQINFMVAALQDRWRHIKIDDLDRVDGIELNSATQYALVNKAIELKSHPIDPFPSAASLQESIDGQESSIARLSHASDAVGANSVSPERSPNLAESSSEPNGSARAKEVKKIDTSRRRSSKDKRVSSDKPKASALSAAARLEEAREWIRTRVIPMIELARVSSDWSALGSKGWSGQDSTQFHRVCSYYTGTVNNWYKALVALSQEYAAELKGGALKAAELETIKLQVEAKRRSAISGRKSTFDPASAVDFIAVEMPALIAQARSSNDWTELKPAVMTANFRIRRLVETVQGNASMQTFVRRPEFGLSQRELDLIDGKVSVDPRIAENDFQQVLRNVITPIIARCRLNSDYRPLEPERIAQNPLIVGAIEYLTGKPNSYQSFYRNNKVPLTEAERTILSAKEFTPTRCEAILETKLRALISDCRGSNPPDFTALNSLRLKEDRELIALARYLSRSQSISVRALLSHPRVGLSDAEISLVYNQTPLERIIEIRSTKWAALLAKCREQDDFSYLRTALLKSDPDFAALLNYYSNGRRKDVKDILVQDLGVRESEQKKIIRVFYNGDYCMEIARTKIYPVLLECLRKNDFAALEFDNLFADRQIIGMANSLLAKRPSVVRLLSHPLVGLSLEEAETIVKANKSNDLRVRREALRDELIEKVTRLTSVA